MRVSLLGPVIPALLYKGDFMDWLGWVGVFFAFLAFIFVAVPIELAQKKDDDNED